MIGMERCPKCGSLMLYIYTNGYRIWLCPKCGFQKDAPYK